MTKAAVGSHARHGNWMQRRKEAQNIADDKAARKLTTDARKAGKLSTEDEVRIIDGWIMRFAQSIKENSVRTDAAGDLNTLMRLREFMEGRADSRVEVQGQIGIEILVGRHEEWRKRVVEATFGEDGAEEPDQVTQAIGSAHGPELSAPKPPPEPELEPVDAPEPDESTLPLSSKGGNDDE